MWFSRSSFVVVAGHYRETDAPWLDHLCKPSLHPSASMQPLDHQPRSSNANPPVASGEGPHGHNGKNRPFPIEALYNLSDE
jgi:hypothetical protein